MINLSRCTLTPLMLTASWPYTCVLYTLGGYWVMPETTFKVATALGLSEIIMETIKKFGTERDRNESFFDNGMVHILQYVATLSRRCLTRPVY